MWHGLVAALGLGAVCGVWVMVQRLVERHVPEHRDRHPGCAGCSKECVTDQEPR